MTRTQHIEQSKQRAQAHIQHGDPERALQSFLGDLGSHQETAGDGRIQLFLVGLCFGVTPEKVSRFIEEFN